jgi:hypothetical protein
MIKEILYKNMLKGIGYTTGSLLTLGFAYIITLGIEYRFFKTSNKILKEQEEIKPVEEQKEPEPEHFSDCINNETSDFLTLEPEKVNVSYKKLFDYIL